MEANLNRTYKRSRKKRGWQDGDGIIEDLKSAFTRQAPVPKGMAEELAAWYLPSPQIPDANTISRCEEILLLLNDEWTPENSLLGPDDWEFLSDLVNDWAEEMDMKVATHIMRVVVEMG